MAGARSKLSGNTEGSWLHVRKTVVHMMWLHNVYISLDIFYLWQNLPYYLQWLTFDSSSAHACRIRSLLSTQQPQSSVKQGGLCTCRMWEESKTGREKNTQKKPTPDLQTYHNRLLEILIHSCIPQTEQVDPIKAFLVPRKRNT